MPIKKQWEPMWVKVKATRETVCIKDYRFNPELHAPISSEEEVVEEAAPEVEEEEKEVFTCEDCDKEMKSKAGLVSHKRYCKNAKSEDTEV